MSATYHCSYSITHDRGEGGYIAAYKITDDADYGVQAWEGTYRWPTPALALASAELRAREAVRALNGRIATLDDLEP
jgi:hypothetical protein